MEMNEEEIKDKLTEQEYNVLRESGTEATILWTILQREIKRDV